MSELNEFDTEPHSYGVMHGPYVPYTHEEVLLRTIESQVSGYPETETSLQEAYQLFMHKSAVIAAYREGRINDVSRYLLCEAINYALK